MRMASSLSDDVSCSAVTCLALANHNTRQRQDDTMTILTACQDRVTSSGPQSSGKCKRVRLKRSVRFIVRTDILCTAYIVKYM